MRSLKAFSLHPPLALLALLASALATEDEVLTQTSQTAIPISERTVAVPQLTTALPPVLSNRAAEADSTQQTAAVQQVTTVPPPDVSSRAAQLYPPDFSLMTLTKREQEFGTLVPILPGEHPHPVTQRDEGQKRQQERDSIAEREAEAVSDKEVQTRDVEEERELAERGWESAPSNYQTSTTNPYASYNTPASYIAKPSAVCGSIAPTAGAVSRNLIYHD